MASFPAIAATGDAILGILAEGRPRPEFDNARFELLQPADFQRNTPPLQEGISLLLYRVEVTASMRNRPARMTADGGARPPGLPLDLHYLLTAWAATSRKQQRLLAWAMHAMDERPVIPSGLLNGPGPEPDVFRPEESVEVAFESLGLQDLANIWQFAQASWQPSVGYVARVVTLEPAATDEAGAPIQTRAFGFGRPAQP